MIAALTVAVLAGIALWLGLASSTGARAGAVVSARRREHPKDRDASAAAEHTGRGITAPPLPAAALVELTATQLEAGLPLADAVTALGESRAGRQYPQLGRVGAGLKLGLDWDTAWAHGGEIPRPLAEYRDALEFTANSATASATALRGQAEQVRRAQFRRAERAAEALSVRLVLPLGLCCLPAFMCWGVLPVLMGLLPKVFGS